MASPLVRITARLEREVSASLELAWKAYRSANDEALAKTPSGLPAPDGLLQTQQLWLVAKRAREEYMRILRQFTKLTTDRQIPDEFQERVKRELEDEKKAG